MKQYRLHGRTGRTICLFLCLFGAGSSCQRYPMQRADMQSTETLPLTVFQYNDYTGDEAGIPSRTVFRGDTIPDGMNDNFSSFHLLQGFMATFAEHEDGTGFGFSYVARSSDVTVNLPAQLAQKVSFIRVLPVQNVLKKGVGNTNNTLIDSLNVSWFYDWGPLDHSTPTREYVPMAWGRGAANNPSRVDAYIEKDTVTHLLSFNEPDNASQSNIPYTEAVSLHKLLLRTGYRMGSPAPEEGNADKWLLNFMNKADQDTVKVDFMALHWYDWGNWSSTHNASPNPANVFNRFKNYLTRIYNLYKKPIWITEFNANRNTTPETHARFMELALPWLDAQPFIERYAYFFPPTVPAMENDTLTEVGRIYRDHVSTPSITGNIIYGDGSGGEEIPENMSIIPLTNELILPQYAYTGQQTTARLHYVCRLRLTGLAPNATYRYFTGLSDQASRTTQTPGWLLAIQNSSSSAGYIVGMSSSNKSVGGSRLDNNENYTGTGSKFSTFTTNASGNYTGWFAVVPTNQEQHQAGKNVYFFVQVNNGSGGTSLNHTFRTQSTISMLDYSTITEDIGGASAVKGISTVGDEKIVVLYSDTAMNDRPLYASFTEDDGIPQPYTNWYGTVNASEGQWGALIPNYLTSGVRAIRYVSINGSQLALFTSSNGEWGTTETVHPDNGSTPITIETP